MKKAITVAVSLLLLLGFTSFTFARDRKPKAAKAAQGNIEIIKGKVVSVDQAKREIIVKDNKTQLDRSFVAGEKAIAAVKVGDEVRVKVKVGSANAESVKILKSEEKKK